MDHDEGQREGLKVGWMRRGEIAVKDWMDEEWAEILNEEDGLPCYLRPCGCMLLSGAFLEGWGILSPSLLEFHANIATYQDL